MRQGNYLQRHGRRFRFRMRFPKKVVPFRFRSDLVVSLRTDSFSVAIKRARFLRVEVESLMVDLSGALNRADAERMVRAWVDECGRKWEANMALSGGFAFFNKDEVESMGEENAREMDDLFRVIGETMVRPAIKEMASGALSGRRPDQAAALEPVFASTMKEIAPDVDRTSVDGHILARTFLRGLATLVDEQSALERGDLVSLPRGEAVQPSSSGSTAPAPIFPFAEHWTAFEESKITEGEWKADTGTNARATRNLFVGLMGDVPVSVIDRGMAALFRRLLFGLPSKYDKQKCWRGLSLHEVIGKAAEIGNAAGPEKTQSPVKFMSLRTADKHFNNLVEYWKWLQKTGQIAKEHENPFTGFIQSKPQGKRARHERNAWPQDLSLKLFSSPVWTGCSSFNRRSKPGPHIYRDAKFWVPLIGRMLGAREDEICSLDVGDVRFVDGIAVFHIANSKTDGSERDLPLPEALLRLGFLEYRYYGRAPDAPLFPELLPQGVEGRRSPSFSSWFTEYRKAVEVYQLLVDFHSFRHNVSTDLDNLPGLNTGWADEITGHESQIRASERSRYSKGVFMRHLKDTLDRIDIGVSLDHLAYNGEFGVAAPGAAKDILMFSERAVRNMAAKACHGRQMCSVERKAMH